MASETDALRGGQRTLGVPPRGRDAPSRLAEVRVVAVELALELEAAVGRVE
jgi:hypothetical protein